MSNRRTELQQEVVDALISSNAVNFEVFGNVLAQFGARAARTGDAIGLIVGRPFIVGCIPPFRLDEPVVGQSEETQG